VTRRAAIIAASALVLSLGACGATPVSSVDPFMDVEDSMAEQIDVALTALVADSYGYGGAQYTEESVEDVDQAERDRQCALGDAGACVTEDNDTYADERGWDPEEAAKEYDEWAEKEYGEPSPPSDSELDRIRRDREDCESRGGQWADQGTFTSCLGGRPGTG
jgi:hypothetical protein